MAGGKGNILGIGVFVGLLVFSAYSGLSVQSSIRETKPVMQRIEAKYSDSGHKLSSFDFMDLLRPGVDKFTSDHGTWSFAGLVWNLPAPLDAVAPEGYCFWVKCEREGGDCIAFEDCGFGQCSKFEEAAKNPGALDCRPVFDRKDPLF